MPERTEQRPPDDLIRFSAEIGRDPTMVQAAGGNTSAKTGERMWIKASGTWLADAPDRSIMVAVDLPRYRDALLANDPTTDNASAFLADRNATLRPSVETAMHAVMPHAWVAHVHCVDTIAWAVQRAAEGLLTDRLDGFSWAFVPYIKPGLPLARTIAETADGADILVLGSHGLVVGADTIDALASRLSTVRNRLRRTVDPRLSDAAEEGHDLDDMLEGTPFRPAREPVAHALALLPDLIEIAAAGTLYPDHAVFLGPSMRLAADRHGVADVADDPLAKAVLVPGRGMGIRENALRGTDALARCLVDVVSRLRIDDDVVYLRNDEVADLLDWDAEKYRQSLNVVTPAP